MRDFQPPYEEDKERPDIYQLIKSKSQSPQMVIDYIKDHQMMHFGTADLSETFNFIILYCYTTGQERLAKHIYDEFRDEIAVHLLIFKLMEYKVPAIEIDQYFEEYDGIVLTILNKTPNPHSIFIQAFKEYKDNGNIEYFEMIIDGKNFMQAIKDNYLPTMFTGFQRRMFMQPTAVELFKKILSVDLEFSDILVKTVGDDVEVLEVFFPEAKDLFIF
jgi:hypothetical protein